MTDMTSTTYAIIIALVVSVIIVYRSMIDSLTVFFKKKQVRVQVDLTRELPPWRLPIVCKLGDAILGKRVFVRLYDGTYEAIRDTDVQLYAQQEATRLGLDPQRMIFVYAYALTYCSKLFAVPTGLLPITDYLYYNPQELIFLGLMRPLVWTRDLLIPQYVHYSTYYDTRMGAAYFSSLDSVRYSSTYKMLASELFAQEISPARCTMQDLFAIMESSRALYHALPQYLDRVLFERYLRHLLIYEQLMERRERSVLPDDVGGREWVFESVKDNKGQTQSSDVLCEQMDAYINKLRQRFGTIYKFLVYRHWKEMRINYEWLEVFVEERWQDIKRTEQKIERNKIVAAQLSTAQVVNKYFRDTYALLGPVPLYVLMQDLHVFQNIGIVRPSTPHACIVANLETIDSAFIRYNSNRSPRSQINDLQFSWQPTGVVQPP